MKLSWKLFFLAGLIVGLTRCPPVEETTGNVERDTLQGTVIGERHSYDKLESIRYLGIPYAKPPVGDLRFRPPEDPEVFPGGELEAFDFGSECIQRWGSGSEDCLFLNIWTPPDAEPGDKLPVLAYIHGGGNTALSPHGDWPAFLSAQLLPEPIKGTLFSFLAALGINTEPKMLYNGHYLAGDNNVIVVTMHYRLGPLGFLSHPSLGEGSGNFAYLDVQKSLEWLQANIAQFGGDENNVTIGGDSAGGWNACAMMNMPGAKGLFHKATIRSGMCMSRSGGQARAASHPYLESTGCENEDDVAVCLRRVDSIQFKENGTTVAYVPTVDGDVFPEWFGDSIEGEDFNHVPVMLGTTKEELVSRIATDIGFNCPGQANLKIFGDHLRAPVYRYSFEYRNLSAPLAFHGADNSYFFGSVSDLNPNPWNNATSKKIRGYWTNFMHTGDPNGSGLPSWHRYTNDKKRYMRLKLFPNADSGSMVGVGVSCFATDFGVSQFWGDMIEFW